ncbi:hypothetical protein PUN28_011814 [Cardiocondyla obscurior]|uniref:Uncharacterized protein n=1 Tax=Cardiocondyla obscurior TaxID=286306 RepID=A0AAW2FFM2_9HYME
MVVALITKRLNQSRYRFTRNTRYQYRTQSPCRSLNKLRFRYLSPIRFKSRFHIQYLSKLSNTKKGLYKKKINFL